MTRRQSITAVIVGLLAFLGVMCASWMGSRIFPSDKAMGFGGGFGAPLSYQGGAPSTSFVGTVDPTNTTWAGGMVCTDTGTPTIAEQNRAAMQAVINYASTNNVEIYVPPCAGYPMGQAAGESYGVTFAGRDNISIRAYNATFRQYGDAASSAFEMFAIRDADHVQFMGATFSQRDVTNETADTVAVMIGDDGATTVDDVKFTDCAFLEGVGGDYVRIDGGDTEVTVTHVSFPRSNRFENAIDDAIEIQPGVADVLITYNWFKSNDGIDIHCNATSDTEIGQLHIEGNTFERTTSSTDARAMLISGSGGTNQNLYSLVTANRIVDGVIQVEHFARGHIVANDVRYNVDRGATANLDILGNTYDAWFERNYLYRGPSATAGSVIKTAVSDSHAAGALHIVANRIHQYTGISPGIDISGALRADVEKNSIEYHSATADSGATGFVGIYCTGVTDGNPCSANIRANNIRRGDQDINAELDIDPLTPNVDTIVEARTAGTFGNDIDITLVGDSGTNPGSRVETSTLVTLHYKPAGTTVTQLEALINGSAVIKVKTAGTGANVLQVGDAITAQSLSGGLAAGQMLAGVLATVGSLSMVNSYSIRDNVVDGARVLFYSDAEGSGDWTEGFPVIDGNFFLNGTNYLEGGITTVRQESTPNAETVTSGALSISREYSFVTTANTVAYTLANGSVDGSLKCGKIKSVSGTPAGTLTPTAFADGSTHTITWSTAGGWFCLVWDNTSTTWRLRGSSGVTIN